MCCHHMESLIRIMEAEVDADHDAFRIALYYCYIPLHDIQAVVDFHGAFQSKLGGRIRVATEGLNGVLSGRHIDLIQYEERLCIYLKDIFVGIKGEDNVSSSWDLDVKYCKLRRELSVNSQLFEKLVVDKASSVVELVGTQSFQHGQSSQENSPKKGYAENRRQRRKQQKSKDELKAVGRVHEIFQKSLEQRIENRYASPHLSPSEWNHKLRELSQQPDAKVVLLDCRNSYESAVGYFQAPGATTILTNTRKYSELPMVLMEQSEKALRTASHIFTYCTGGVRCDELAKSGFLQTLFVREQANESIDTDRRGPKIFQLHGGIQRYLESDHASLYKGKNFVFDPRRTDPAVGEIAIVGQCLVCATPHDDYDNGHAPSANMEARCYKCRILVLVCDACRPRVTCWGESSEVPRANPNPKLYCGGLEPSECLHMPPVREIRA